MIDSYHSDTTTLSNSSAKWLLPPHCPAKFRWIQDHPEDRPTTKTLNFGKAAHRFAFGAGEDYVVIAGSGSDENAWRTKADIDAVALARASNVTPIKPKDEPIIRGMAEALRAHPVAAALFDPDHGKAEVPLYWTDPATGVPLRCRLDWLPDRESDYHRLVIPDYKTAESGHPEKFRKSAMDYGYHRQAAWYIDGVRALGMDDDPRFVFVVQEKNPPYLVSVVELGELSLNIGRNLNYEARRIYAECVQSGHWPGYGDEITQVELPDYYLWQHDESEEIVV